MHAATKLDEGWPLHIALGHRKPIVCALYTARYTSVVSPLRGRNADKRVNCTFNPAKTLPNLKSRVQGSIKKTKVGQGFLLEWQVFVQCTAFCLNYAFLTRRCNASYRQGFSGAKLHPTEGSTQCIAQETNAQKYYKKSLMKPNKLKKYIVILSFMTEPRERLIPLNYEISCGTRLKI